MGRWNDLKGILSAAARLSSVTADACDLVTAARRLRSAPPRVCPHRQPSAARSDARAAPTQACTVNHRRIEHRSMVTPAASEVETRLPASPLQLWASPAQAKQTLLQKRRRVDAPRAHILGLPSRRARVKAEPTSCRRGGCGWAAGRPVAGARQAVARRRRSACYKFGVPVRFLWRVRIASIRGKPRTSAESVLSDGATGGEPLARMHACCSRGHGRNDASPAALTRARALRDGNARSSRPPRQPLSTPPAYR